MDIQRRQLLRLAGGVAALPILSRVAGAQTYPTRPVRILVGYSAGGGVDITARLMGHWLSERLGQQFVIENRTGAATNIATEAVIRSPADGYTLLLTNAANAINATYYDNLNFDFVRDTTAVGSIMSVPFVMVVNPSLPVKSLPELIAYAKANPRKINVGTGGAGGPDHASLELFKIMTGTDMVHVPYRGLSPALTDLISGQIQLVFSTVPAAIQYVKGGKLRALAVTTRTRSDVLPEIPVVGDTVKGFELNQWYGIVAPKGTPAAIVATLNKEIRASFGDAKIKARLADLGGVPMSTLPAEFAKFIADQTQKWGKVIKVAGIKAK